MLLVRVARFLPLIVAGCVPHWQGAYDRLLIETDRLVDRFRVVAPGPSTDPDLDKKLSESLEVDALVEIALSRNPELREALARTRAALEEVRRVGSLDEPALKFEAWALPLDKPLAFDRDQTNMIGLMQSIPFPGKLNARSEAALREAESMFQMYREKEREIISQVKRAFYTYFALAKELQIHLEHVKILEEFEQISAVKFKTGVAQQQDVLKPQVELVMLHNDVLYIEQRLESTRAEINRLLNRPCAAPLGRPQEVAPPGDERFDLASLLKTAQRSRPELLAAELKRQASSKGVDVAERDATLPDFSIGADYWQMPDAEDAWGLTFAVNLPWFSGKRSAEVRKTQQMLRADEAALERIRARIDYEVRDAYARVEAARKSVILFKGELLSKSRQSVEVSRASYEKGRATFLDLLDAERSLRDIRLEYFKAIAEYATAVSELERAVGVDLRKKP